ncbi:hypothetical protein A2U01_0088238, partial [Trifolium medium]|nr:hypothetical protein [Trifolium medium]
MWKIEVSSCHLSAKTLIRARSRCWYPVLARSANPVTASLSDLSKPFFS